MTDEQRAPDLEAIRARLAAYQASLKFSGTDCFDRRVYRSAKAALVSYAPADIDALLKRVEELQTALEYYGYDVADDTGEIARAALTGED